MTAARIVGQAHASQIEKLSLELYQQASLYLAERGIIIADTKFEFGLDESTMPAAVVLVDEVLTPGRCSPAGLFLSFLGVARHALGMFVSLALSHKSDFSFSLEEVMLTRRISIDSSRFWSVEKYEVGRGQDSYDKQYLRGR